MRANARIWPERRFASVLSYKKKLQADQTASYRQEGSGRTIFPDRAGGGNARSATDLRGNGIMFDEFAYRQFHVRAGVRQSRTDGGAWYGIVSLGQDSQETTYSLVDRLFPWPAAARRYAARYAKDLIDALLSERSPTREPHLGQGHSNEAHAARAARPHLNS